MLILKEKGLNLTDVELLRQELLAKSRPDMPNPEN